MTFDVRVFLPDGVTDTGTISYTSQGPKLSCEENHLINVPRKLIEFSITDTSIYDSALLDKQDRINLDSLTFYKKMNRDNPVTQDHYPLSTKGWIRYLSQNGPLIRIDLQEINNGDRYLLSSVDIATGDMIRFHSIKSFETNILRLEPDWERYSNLIVESDEEEVSLERLLEAPAPSWEELQFLVQGISIPSLKRKETAGDTLSQLVPSTFPEDVRKELIVFLAWTLHARIPEEDPLEFKDPLEFIGLNRRIKTGPLLQSLIVGHVQCLTQGIPPPQYVRIFTLAERGALTMGVKPQTERSEQEVWSKAMFRIESLVPNRNDRIAELTNHLNLSQEIHPNLPITKEQAAKSNDAWLDRLSLITSNLVMRAHIQDKKLGLEKMVYIGGAHRWPHRHLQYAARLGNVDQKPPYIQVMAMPKTAVDRISRIKQNVFSIDWSASRVNFNLYNAERDSWRYNAAHFLKSFKTQRTRKQLDKEFDLVSSPDIIQLDEKDIKLLDLMFWGLVLHSNEVGNYDDILYPMTYQEIHDRIQRYMKEKIVQLRYNAYTPGRVSICLEIRGPLKQLHSISRASLKHLPTATVMLSSPEDLCIVMARVPESEVYSILTELPVKVKEYGITMKAYRVPAYAGYLHNFYQRLQRQDGTWDDDVSGLLSQITK